MEDKNFSVEEYCLNFRCAHIVILAQHVRMYREDRRINYFDHKWEFNTMYAWADYYDPEQNYDQEWIEENL